ncbi:Gfo/Idh/MocA family protein [Rhodoferax koreense]|nr:Gfo/Idh/MocA family oxidoreductase [Rhodoferax koreense]
MARTTIHWGVLGAAAIATQRTMPALQLAPSATLMALASRDLAKGQAAAQALGIPKVYASYDALLDDPEIDAVYVPLPNQLHFEWSVRALEAGKHVLCEKPLCLTADQVQQLCEVRDRTGKHIEEGFGFRNHPQWARFDELLAADAIGPVRAAHATLAKQFLDPKDVRNDPNAGGGALYDLGSYAVSACNLVFKRPPLRVVAALEYDPVFRIDRVSSALLDYGDAHAALTVATQAGPDGWGTHQQLSVLGGHGWLRFDFPYAQARPTACHIEVGDHTSVGYFPNQSLEFEPVNQYVLQVERFSRLLLGQAVPSWPIEDALGTLRTIEALFASSRSGGWVALPTGG